MIDFRATMLGSLELVTAPTALVLTLAELKRHLRIDESDDDQYLEELLAEAQRFVEQEIQGHRQLITATYDLPVACWWEGPLRLPRPPLQSVTTLKYYDSAGTLQTVDSGDYLVRTPLRQYGTIERAPGATWPTFEADRRLPIVIRFVAGWTASNMPWTIKRAVKLVAAHWFEERLPVGSVSAQVSFSLKDLLDGEGFGSYA